MTLEKRRGNRDVHADQETEMELDKEMKALKKRPWIGTRKGKGEGDLDIRGEDLSTVKH
jgi:hypothetical protein